MFTIEFISEIDIPIVQGNADILIISGNVSKIDALHEMCLKYIYIFWILSDYVDKKTIYVLNRIFPYPNYKFLEKSRFDIGNIRILGATLWKEISVKNIVSNDDIDCIYNHYKTLSWFKQEFDRAIKDNKKVLIATYFPPLKSIISEYKNIIICWIYGKSLKYVNVKYLNVSILSHPGNYIELPDFFKNDSKRNIIFF